jgi:hypothetical protein
MVPLGVYGLADSADGGARESPAPPRIAGRALAVPAAVPAAGAAAGAFVVAGLAGGERVEFGAALSYITRLRHAVHVTDEERLPADDRRASANARAV